MYFLFRPLTCRLSGRGQFLLFTVLIIIALNAPDVDFLLMYLGWVDSHGTLTHSLTAAVCFSLVYGAFCRWLFGRVFSYAWFTAVVFICYSTHLIMDIFTYGRGVLLFWPVLNERIHSPVPLFYGARHSELFAFDKHLITLTTELAYGGLVYISVMLVFRYRKMCQNITRSQRMPEH